MENLLSQPSEVIVHLPRRGGSPHQRIYRCSIGRFHREQRNVSGISLYHLCRIDFGNEKCVREIEFVPIVPAHPFCCFLSCQPRWRDGWQENTRYVCRFHSCIGLLLLSTAASYNETNNTEKQKMAHAIHRLNELFVYKDTFFWQESCFAYQKADSPAVRDNPLGQSKQNGQRSYDESPSRSVENSTLLFDAFE